MLTQVSTVQPTALTPLAVRVWGEYGEMPGLRLTVCQAVRLFGRAPEVAAAVLHELQHASILACSHDGVFALASEPSRRRTSRLSASEPAGKVDVGALTDVSLDRLVCLLRHWTWADEAMGRFDRELANGWDYDDDPLSDHPFGAYYHWCALLCGFGEAALDHGLLSPSQLEPIRADLEAWSSSVSPTPRRHSSFATGATPYRGLASRSRDAGAPAARA